MGKDISQKYIFYVYWEKKMVHDIITVFCVYLPVCDCTAKTGDPILINFGHLR